MKLEVKWQMAEDLVDDVIKFFETHTLDELKYVPDAEDEHGQITAYDELTNRFLSTMYVYMKGEGK